MKRKQHLESTSHGCSVIWAVPCWTSVSLGALTILGLAGRVCAGHRKEPLQVRSQDATVPIGLHLGGRLQGFSVQPVALQRSQGPGSGFWSAWCEGLQCPHWYLLLSCGSHVVEKVPTLSGWVVRKKEFRGFARLTTLHPSSWKAALQCLSRAARNHVSRPTNEITLL